MLLMLLLILPSLHMLDADDDDDDDDDDAADPAPPLPNSKPCEHPDIVFTAEKLNPKRVSCERVETWP